MTQISQAAQAQRDAARGNGVAHAGQFGHQAHTAPGTFEAADEAAIPVPVVTEIVRPMDVQAGDRLDMSRVASAYLDRNPEDDDLAEPFTDAFLNGPRTVDRVVRNDGELSIRFADEDWSKGDTWGYLAKQDETDPDHAPARVLDEEAAIERRRSRLSDRSDAIWRQRSAYQREVANTAADLARMALPTATKVHASRNEETFAFELAAIELEDGTMLERDQLEERADLEEASTGINALLGEMDREDPDWLWRNDETDGSDEPAMHFLPIDHILETETPA